MTQYSKTFIPGEAEEKWYQYWTDHKFFHSEPDGREPYTMVIPPPNVTGVLHMGHMLNNTIQDVLVRRARMKGCNACWVPGTDHASIATEAKVVGMLREKGISKGSISREEFIKHAWEWKEKYGGIILEQLKKLGASCDWDRTKFTMDAPLSEAVTDTFIHLYQKGLIYRGLRMVNWDPQGRTAVSDEEVIRKEVNQKLYYVRYQVAELSQEPALPAGRPASRTGRQGTRSQDTQSQYIVIATTRPETIMADTGVCIHPDDERYTWLQGKRVIVPLVDREVPVIQDEYVDIGLGTGCLKVTPAHDPNDYELGRKHGLETIDILSEDGSLNEKAGILVGEDRFAARKEVVSMLEEAGLLEKVEAYKSQVGFSERTDAVIEPRLSMQWFVKMKEMAKPALEAVERGEVKLIPDKFRGTYRHWMENVRDWCVSRQLWWGHRIPAWYDEQGNYAVAKTEAEAREQLAAGSRQLAEGELKQDEDVLDTWFSSWLWPITVFDPSVPGNPGGKGNKDLQYYYPTSDLVTAPEILFFWVARMIIAGIEFRGEVPFKNVYLTGIVRDKKGRKMSKSLGNSPDPVGLIEQYGADGVRVGMLLSSPAGNDLLFDIAYCEQGRNFANKIWNAFRLIIGWKVDEKERNRNEVAITWFENKFNAELEAIEQLFSQYRLSEALMAVYKLVWDDFCSWYLEMVKPAYGASTDRVTYSKTLGFLEGLLKILHPFMPFITEEIWHEITSRKEGDCIMVAAWPRVGTADKRIVEEMEKVVEVIVQIRNIRNAKQIAFKQALPLAIKAGQRDFYRPYEGIISLLAGISEIAYVSEKAPGSSFLVGRDELFVDIGTDIDTGEEKERLVKELEHQRGFLNLVMKKLNNDRFMRQAPAKVVENERKKRADAEARIKALQESLERMNNF